MSYSKTLCLQVFLCSLFLSGCTQQSDLKSFSHRKENFDFDWSFAKGDFPNANEISFDDSKWKNLDVPHDWCITDTFSKEHPTGKSGGFASGGIGWYRKSFSLNQKG